MDRILEHLLNMLDDINNLKNLKFKDKIIDIETFKKELNDFMNDHNRHIMNLIYKNDDIGIKRYLVHNFVKPKFFPESLVEKQYITKIAIEQQVVTEAKKAGRPKGSKNKPKEVMITLPIHQVNDQNFIDAIKDLLWYRSGMMANEIIKYLEHDESITKLIYAKLHEYDKKHWVEKKISGKYGRPIYKWYAIGERKGYFYNGKLYSLTKLAEEVGMNKVTLWKRIKSGMNHIEAINNPIKENMVRSGKNN